MCERPGQVPVSRSTRACRRPLAWLVMKSDSHGDLDGENHGDEPVDGGAERRPPSCIGHVVAALLPEVLETMACVAKDEEPGRSSDARGGKQDERARDGALDGDHLRPSVCHREPDVDRCNQGQQESLDGCLVEPPEDERRRGLGGAKCQSPQDQYTYRLLPVRSSRRCGCHGNPSRRRPWIRIRTDTPARHPAWPSVP